MLDENRVQVLVPGYYRGYVVCDVTSGSKTGDADVLQATKKEFAKLHQMSLVELDIKTAPLKGYTVVGEETAEDGTITLLCQPSETLIQQLGTAL